MRFTNDSAQNQRFYLKLSAFYFYFLYLCSAYLFTTIMMSKNLFHFILRKILFLCKAMKVLVKFI